MTPVLGRIAPGRTGRWNLAIDLVAVGGALAASMVLRGGDLDSVALHVRMAIGLAVWVLAAAALHHYDPWADERGTTDDAMMVTVLCAAVATSLFFLNRFASGLSQIPRTVQTFSLLWPVVVSLRLFVFRPIAR